MPSTLFVNDQPVELTEENGGLPGSPGAFATSFFTAQAMDYMKTCQSRQEPCFVRWPAGGYAGTTATAREMPRMVSEMDLPPTFMDVLNLHDVAHRPPQVRMHGRSFKTLLDVDPKNDDQVFGSRVLVVDNQRLDNLVKYKQASVMRDELDAAGQRPCREIGGQPVIHSTSATEKSNRRHPKQKPKEERNEILHTNCPHPNRMPRVTSNRAGAIAAAQFRRHSLR